MKNLIFILIFIQIAIGFVRCSKNENTTPENTHPYAGTVRLYETKRNWSLKYGESSTYSYFSVSVGTNELIEFIPAENKNQYYIRAKDYPTKALDAQAKDELFIKLYTYYSNESQLFNVIDIGDNKIKIQSVVDTSLYLLNDSDLASFSYSSFLKPKSTYPTALDYWRIEIL